jgi:hypothetical protein
VQRTGGIESSSDVAALPASWRARSSSFARRFTGKRVHVILAASTVAIVAIAAVIIVALIALIYIVPRGGRKRR